MAIRYAVVALGALRHPKMLSLSDRGVRLWLAGLVYCQEFLTDGRLPAEAVSGLLPGIKITRAHLDELERAGLWTRAVDGWIVHDYLQWNKSRAEVLELRQQWRERQARHRTGA